MLQLLNPIALLAATAVLLPILVHLWRERTGKTLRIGSIILLSNNNRTRSNSLRIYNWPLFLLRCLLVLLLAFLLAKPVWQKTPIAGSSKGWILIPKAERRLAYTQYKTQIDSLLAAQWELHDLGEGFHRYSITEPLAPPTQLESKEAGAPRIYLEGEAESADMATWSLLKDLDAALPSGYPLQVFTSNRQVQYQGTRPATHLALRWHSYAAADTVITTHTAAWITPGQALKTLEQNASAAGIQYAMTTMAMPPQDIEVDTSIQRITLYPGRHAADAGYLKAALQAIAEVSEHRFSIQSLADDQLPALPQQLIIQLNASPTLPLSSLTPGGKLLRYDTGNVVRQASWQQPAGEASLRTISNRTYTHTYGATTGRAVWTLANGRPLLTVQDTAGKQLYRFSSQFNPAAADMVWSDDFAQQLLPIVLATPATTPANDIRSIDDRQAIPTAGTTSRPANIAGNVKAATGNDDHTDLTQLVGLLVLLVFAAERIWVYRQQNTIHHG